MIVLILSASAYSQIHYTVTGKLTDSIGRNIGYTNVSLKFSKDSLTTNTDSLGNFFLIIPAVHSFSITIRSLNYLPCTIYYTKGENFTISNENIHIKNIILTQKTHLVKEVIIIGHSPPVIFKKDTIEYDATAFYNINDNTIEDLLKRLPGLQVDNGSVSSQGQNVVKIKVNGKDFFTGDINQYIKELPADIVAKIQIVDDYGDHSHFLNKKTGPPIKILNIVLKHNIKNGIFGELSSAYQTIGQYQFTGDGNLWEEDRQVGINSIINTPNKASGIGSTNGLNLFYRDNLSKKVNISVNYSFKKNVLDTKVDNLNQIVNISGPLTISNSITNDNSTKNNSLLLNLNYTIDTNSFLTASSTFISTSNNAAIYTLSNETGVIMQYLNSFSSSSVYLPAFNNNISFSHRFKKTGRTLNINNTFNYNHNDNLQTTRDSIKYNNSNLQDSLLNQLVTNKIKTSQLLVNATYSEPLNKSMYADINYSYNTTNQGNLFFTGQRNQKDIYHTIDSLSGNGSNTIEKQSIGGVYHYINQKITFDIGLNFQHVQTTVQSNTPSIYSRTINDNIYPTAEFNYYISSKNFLAITYSGFSISPTYQQLQATPNTINIQDVIVGNPGLKTAFSHILTYNFRYVANSGFTFMMNGGVSFTQNKIVENTILEADTADKVTQLVTSYKNANGSYNGNIGQQISFPSFKIGKSIIQIAYRSAFNYDYDVTYLNDKKNGNKHQVTDQALNIHVNNDFSDLSFGASYHEQNNLFNVENQQMFTTTNYNFLINNAFRLKNGINIILEANKSVNEGFQTLHVSNPLIINLSINRNILKNPAIDLSVQARDLLNKGNTFYQSLSENSVLDTYNHYVTRYVTVLFKIKFYNFNNKSGSAYHKNK